MVYFWKNVALNFILLYYLKDLTKKRERLRLHSTLVHLMHSPRVPWFEARRFSMFLLALRFLSVVSTQISALPLVLFAQDTQDEAAWSKVQGVSYKLYFCIKWGLAILRPVRSSNTTSHSNAAAKPPCLFQPRHVPNRVRRKLWVKTLLSRYLPESPL